MQKILLIEDDKDISKLISQAFSSQGFKIYEVHSLSQAYSFLMQSPHLDLIILDLILPDGDGLDLLRYFRTTVRFSKTPIIIISARGAEIDRVLGLELGADDYLVKPFSIRELIIRAKKLLKREQNLTSRIEVGPLLLDKEKKTIFLENDPLLLTPTEYKILELLMENPEKVFTREEISRIVWPLERDYYSRVLDAYICRIRDKLGKFGNLIETIRGFGYRLKVIS